MGQQIRQENGPMTQKLRTAGQWEGLVENMGHPRGQMVWHRVTEELFVISFGVGTKFLDGEAAVA